MFNAPPKPTDPPPPLPSVQDEPPTTWLYVRLLALEQRVRKLEQLLAVE